MLFIYQRMLSIVYPYIVNAIEEVEIDCMQTMDVNRGPLAHFTGMGALSRWEKERLFKATKRRYRQQQ
jgi:hypothetical protein